MSARGQAENQLNNFAKEQKVGTFALLYYIDTILVYLYPWGKFVIWTLNFGLAVRQQ